MKKHKKEKLWPVDFLVVQKSLPFPTAFFYKKTYMHYMVLVGWNRWILYFRLEMKLYY